jgi:hypothetical protein
MIEQASFKRLNLRAVLRHVSPMVIRQVAVRVVCHRGNQILVAVDPCFREMPPYFIFAVHASPVTLKPAIRDQFKTGHSEAHPHIW